MSNRVSKTVRLALAGATLWAGCVPNLGANEPREANKELPESFGQSEPAEGVRIAAQQQWDTYFADPNLKSLIDIALQNNQELNIRLQEVIVANAEVGAARGEYRPRLSAFAGAGIEKVGEHTSQGVSDISHDVAEHLPDFRFGLRASWEVDAWGRMRNAKKAANYRYLVSIEATNFVVTQVVAEIAESYWELVALDKQLEILNENIELQQSALEMVIAKKAASRANQLEVQRFQAEVLKNQGQIFEVKRKQVIVENRINFLVGRFPQPVPRSDAVFMSPAPNVIDTGLPSQLLENRPDVRAAAGMLEAAKLDTKAAKASFYPALSIEADVGYQSFNAKHLIETPQSIAYNLVGNLVAPLLNRSAIKAQYRTANAMQVQAVFEYEQTLLRAFTEVVNELATIDNLNQRYGRIEQQVATLQDAIEMSGLLYRSAHADYMEVLLTRRDFLEAQMELIETKKQQRQALVSVYKALGGGWRREGVTK